MSTRYFHDTKQNRTFYLTSSRKASFIYAVTVPPPDARPATPDEVSAYKAEYTRAWALVTANIGLCYTVLKRMRVNTDREYLVHEVGIPCLLSCAEYWKPTGASFSTYAYRALYRRFKQHLDRTSRAYELHEHPAEYTPDFETSDLVQYILEGVSEYHRLLLVLRFYQELTLKEIADVVGCSKGTIHNHMRQAMAEALSVAT